MIRLSASYRDFNSIAQEWLAMVDEYLDDTRLEQMKISLEQFHMPKTNVALSAEEKKLGGKILDYYKQHLEYFVLADEQKLSHIASCYKIHMNAPRKVLHAALKNVFCKLYKEFREYDVSRLVMDIYGQTVDSERVAYYFFKKLGIRTCPYCNRQYTFTISSSHANTSPEYDHFYEKSKFPILAVSFYNLVPSCHTCNHVKGIQDIRINPFFHEMQGRFSIVHAQSNAELRGCELNERVKKVDWKLKFKETNDADERNIEALGLQELYEQHDDYIDEMIAKTQAYNIYAREALVSAFQGAGYMERDVQNFVWGPYLDTAKYKERPLSKLTHDLLEQFEIIP